MAAPILPQTLQLRQLLDSSLPEDCTFEMLVVSLETASLSSKLAPDAFKVRLKYGRPGASVSCDSPSLEVLSSLTQLSPPAQLSSCSSRSLEEPPPALRTMNTMSGDFSFVDCSMRCYFLWQRWHGSSIRIRLVGSGLFARTIARGTLNLRSLPRSVDLPLHSSTGICVGKIGVSTERVSMTKQQLLHVVGRLSTQLQTQALVSREVARSR